MYAATMGISRFMGKLYRRVSPSGKLHLEFNLAGKKLRRYREIYGELPEGNFDRLEERLVWILGGPRTGSTYLATMLSDTASSVVWNEPLVGRMFGDLYYRGPIRQGRRFILGKPDGLRGNLIRTLVLRAVIGKFPRLKKNQYVFIKEPNGSIGAPLLMEAMPNSRMILLVRDPRDSKASGMAAKSEGGFRREHLEHKRRVGEMNELPEPVPTPFFGLRQSKLAYEAHEGPKVLVRYEDLRKDAASEMSRIFTELGLFIVGGISSMAEKHSWENVPESEKGEKSKKRKARPGSFREDLSEEQIREVERVAGDLMDEFGYERLYP